MERQRSRGANADGVVGWRVGGFTWEANVGLVIVVACGVHADDLVLATTDVSSAFSAPEDHHDYWPLHPDHNCPFNGNET